MIHSKEATLGGLLNGSWMGAGHQEDQAIIRNLEFLVPVSLENGINDQSYLHNEASMKIPILWGSESFGLVNKPTYLGDIVSPIIQYPPPPTTESNKLKQRYFCLRISIISIAFPSQ